MRFMLLLKGDPPEGSVPDERLIGAMLEFNEELVRAGVLLAAEGLHPSARGARVTFRDGRKSVTDGPFTESKELIAGYLVIQAQSMEEAIEWASRCPVEYAAEPGQEAVVEVRQVAEMSELPTATDEQRELEQQIRERTTGS